MSMPSRAPSNGRRLLVLLSGLCALVGGLVLAPGAEAAPKPIATKIVSVTVEDGAGIPVGGPKSPKAVVQVGLAFQLRVTLDAPASYTKDTLVALTRERFQVPTGTGYRPEGPDFGQLVIPAGQVTALTGDLLEGAVANRVVARATVVDGSKEALALAPTPSVPFDVIDAAHITPKGAAHGRFTIGGSSAGTATACDVDAANPYCADVFFPDGTNGDAQLALTPCDDFLGCGVTDPGRPVLQVLFNSTGVGSKTPITAVYRCDKTKCGNVGVTQLDMRVGTGDLTQPLVSLDKCKKQGEQTSPSGYCFDPRQSTKDNAGDIYLYVLLTQDPRLSWP